MLIELRTPSYGDVALRKICAINAPVLFSKAGFSFRRLIKACSFWNGGDTTRKAARAALSRGLRTLVPALAACLVMAALPANAAQTGPASAKSKVQQLTQSLASVSAQFATATGSSRGALSGQLVELATERRAALLALIDSAPGEVLNAELPSRIVNRLPAGVQDLLEYRGTIEGKLQVVHIDYKNPDQSHYAYSVVTDAGARVSLHFASKPTELLTGQRVIARGLIVEGTDQTAMAIQSGTDDVQVAYCCTSGTTSGTTTSVLPHTFGAQKTAVLLVNFTYDLSQPWTVTQINDFMFGAGGVSDWVYEVSQHQTWLEGDTFNWLTVDVPASDHCSLIAFADIVYQAAADAGIDLSSYDRRVIITPKEDCAFAGIADVGGWPSVSRINGYVEMQTVSHEMGHNFGLLHAHALDCGDVPLGGTCTSLQYGDKADTMGSSDPGHFNAFQKLRLGWMDEGGTGAQVVAASTGTYKIAPYETLPDGQPKAVKIPAGVDATTGAQKWFYLTYRQPIGVDSFFDQLSYTFCRGDVTAGVFVHLATDGDPDSSYMLHMKPQSCFQATYGSKDWFDPALPIGGTFVDPATGNSLTVESADSSGATVYVDMSGAGTCVAGNPVVAVTPVASDWGAPGDTVDYTVTVTNTDSTACSTSSLALSASVPSGWGAGFANSTLSLPPGASASTTMSATSATSAPDGTYDVPVTAADGADAGSASATYVVSASLVDQPPIAQDDSATTDSKTPVTIAVLSNDSDPDNDPLSVIQVTKPSKGTAVLNSDGTITYSPGRKASGSDSFSYTISDGTLTASANVQISIANGGGGGGSGGSGGGGWGKGGKP